uniref:Putative secreted protein n=1 Tax=Ixodes ricinus TaxID=34613 RepID=A0A6B0USZ0_IXORI
MVAPVRRPLMSGLLGAPTSQAGVMTAASMDSAVATVSRVHSSVRDVTITWLMAAPVRDGQPPQPGHLTTGTAAIQVSIRNFKSQVDTSARMTRRRRKHKRAIPTRRRQRALSSVTERHGHCDSGYWERHPHCLSVDTT